MVVVNGSDRDVMAVAGMSANLHTALAAGIPGYSPALVVYNRTASKAQPLKNLGAHVAESIQELGTATVVFSISANDASAEQVRGGAL